MVSLFVLIVWAPFKSKNWLINVHSPEKQKTVNPGNRFTAVSLGVKPKVKIWPCEGYCHLFRGKSITNSFAKCFPLCCGIPAYHKAFARWYAVRTIKPCWHRVRSIERSAPKRTAVGLLAFDFPQQIRIHGYKNSFPPLGSNENKALLRSRKNTSPIPGAETA